MALGDWSLNHQCLCLCISLMVTRDASLVGMDRRSYQLGMGVLRLLFGLHLLLEPERSDQIMIPRGRCVTIPGT
jgi:hypothetical protein